MISSANRGLDPTKQPFQLKYQTLFATVSLPPYVCLHYDQVSPSQEQFVITLHVCNAYCCFGAVMFLYSLPIHYSCNCRIDAVCADYDASSTAETLAQVLYKDAKSHIHKLYSLGNSSIN